MDIKRELNAALARIGYQIKAKTPSIYDFLRIKNADVVFDVGANNGQFGKRLRRFGYEGRIVSFEPILAVYEELCRATEADSKWECFNFALSDEDGFAVFNVAQSSQMSSLLPSTPGNVQRDANSSPVRQEQVLLKRLDDIDPGQFGTRPFLKIDVQGAEHKVLAGASSLLGNVVGVQLEVALYQFYEGQKLFTETLSIMEGRGFVPAILEPIGYYDKVDPCRLMELDCTFARFTDGN